MVPAGSDASATLLGVATAPLAAVFGLVPGLHVANPADWFVKESITLLAPTGQANVIVSSEPLDPTLTSSQYASTQGELLRREFPGYVEHRFDESTVFGMFGYLRQFEWTPPDEPIDW